MRFTLPLLALVALAAPAAAEKVVTVKIGYGDVDVTTTEGRAALEARIDARLKKACAAPGAGRYTLNRNAVDSKCLADARVAAIAELDKAVAMLQRGGREVAAN